MPIRCTTGLTTRGDRQHDRLERHPQGQAHGDRRCRSLPRLSPARDDVRNLSGNHPFDGARVSNILPSVADELNLDETEGVVIVAVRSGGIAARLGFQPGDIILQVGDTKITDVVTLDKITREPQRIWRVAIKRGGRVMQLQTRPVDN